MELLPGQVLTAAGRPRLDYRAVAILALPFMLNSAVQAVLSATDTWFIGRLSPAATSAIGAVYWPVLVCVLLFGGVGLAVQTKVAQAYGGRRFARASQAVWTSLWASLLITPVFVSLAFGGARMFAPFGIPRDALDLALQYWFPRMLGGSLAIALWSLLGFFNGIGRPTVTLWISIGVAAANALLNQIFMFDLGMGIAGSGWATDAAQVLGVTAAAVLFLRGKIRARYASNLTYRLHAAALLEQVRLGFPMGLLIAADILGFALFQLMQVRLGTVDGASTQIVMMLTSFCYQPAVGIAMAGTTLVGQAIGAHHRDWAFKIGNGIIVMAVIYMGAIGVVLAALGPWFLPWFTNAADPDSGMVVKRAGLLLWIAAGYQLFDGLNISSSAILRGAADVRLPAIMVLALSWLVFVPLAHSLSFAPGAGWVDWLPQYGLGAVGGWCAALVYVCCLGLTLALRWWSGAWQRITLPLSLAAIAVLASFHPRDARAAEIPAPVAQSMAVQRLPRSTVSFIVVDPDSGRAVASLNAETPRSPASTVKVVTTFAALDMLGPAYTWHTRALARGAPADGVLEGDLYLQGGGDPYMTLERWWSFAQSLRAAGLKTIRGDVVIDDTAFSLPPGNPGDFDGRPNRSYNVLPDALMVNFQSIEFRVAPDRSANRVDIVAVPSPANLDIENHVRLGRGRCGGANGRVDFEVASPQWDKVVFSGALSPHCTERSFARVLLKPATYAFGTFVRLWRELGGEIDGKLRVEAAPADAAVLLDFDSLTLGEIVRLTNKFSSNLMARHLLLTLGEERSGAPGTLEKGAAAIADWGRAAGLDLSGVDIDNGSGLSRTTRITAEQLAAVLRAAYRSRFAPEFMASLPLGGIDGTLRARLRSSPAGAVRLKTGHLDGVTGIAGYVSAASGKTYVVVSLVNDNRADYGAGDSLHTALVDWILDTL